MANIQYYDVILKPVVTEKSMELMADKKYTFLVHTEATKSQIKEAVEKMFNGTKVKSVNTMNLDGKNKRRGMTFGKTAKTKKAVVALTEDSADIKSKLEKAAADEASTNLDNALVDAVIGKMKAEVPQVMYQRRIDEIVREWSARNRISVEDYLKYTGVTMDQFRANFTEVAKRQVDLRLALEKIAELENITVSDEDVEKEYADMAEQYKMEADKIKAAVPADAIKNDLKIEKALDLVRDSAKIEEVTE